MTLKGQKEIREGLLRLLQPKETEFDAFVGDGAGHIEVSGQADHWYVRPIGSDLPIVVKRGAAPQVEGVRVRIGREYDDGRSKRRGRLKIKGVMDTGNVTISSVEAHAGSHLAGGSDPIYIDTVQIINGLVYATSGMNVTINAGWAIISGQPVKWSLSALDLTSDIPGSGALYGLVRVDADGVIDFQAGTPAASFADLTWADVPETEFGYAALAIARLYDGQTALSRLYTSPDVIDIRFAPMSAGAFELDDLSDVNASSPDDGQVLTWDDGAGEWVADDASATDTAAIHDNEAGEIEAISEKLIPVGADILLIEDSQDSDAKKSALIENLPYPQQVGGIFAAAFFDESDESYHVLVSQDGLSWNDAGVSYGDTVRDPSIIHIGAAWWMAHTHDGAPTDLIPIVSSPDLLNWTSVVELDTSAMDNDGDHAWAPEWFVDDDGSVHLFIACGDAGAHQIYETHPTNAAFSTWSDLVAVTGTGFPTDMIDAFVVKLGGMYYLWYKDDDTDYLCYATSTSLLSGYTEIEDGNWASWGSGYEGQCLTRVDNNTWRIYFNATLTNGQYYSESTDNFATWTAKASVSDLTGLSHGTVLNVRDLAGLKDIIWARMINGPVGMTTLGSSKIQFKDAAVAHGMTTLEETDTFGVVKAEAVGYGGLALRGLSEGLIGVVIQAYSTGDDTAKSTAATGIFQVNSAVKSGTGVGAAAANANIAAFRSNAATRAVIDVEGDLHLDATSNVNVWDDHDDVMLLTGLRASLLPDGHEVRARFSDWIEQARPVLEKTGVITYNADGHHFLNVSRMQMLMVDALRQMSERIEQLEAKLIRS